MTDAMHSCSYYCDRPECIKQQRDELRERLEPLLATPECCICGASAPCMQESDLQPGDPGIPCTFDPTAQQLYDWNQVLLDRLVKAEDNLAAWKELRKIDSELLDEVRIALGVKVGHIVEIAKQLVAERDVWRKLVMEHNSRLEDKYGSLMDISTRDGAIKIPPELKQY